jgi:hypothetical protein
MKKKIKAWGLTIELKKGIHLDIEEVFKTKTEAKHKTSKLGFGHQIVPIEITYSLPKKTK